MASFGEYYAKVKDLTLTDSDLTFDAVKTAKKILELDQDEQLTEKSIKKAYRKVSLIAHPDKNSNSEESKKAFQLVENTNSLLKNYLENPHEFAASRPPAPGGAYQQPQDHAYQQHTDEYKAHEQHAYEQQARAQQERAQQERAQQERAQQERARQERARHEREQQARARHEYVRQERERLDRERQKREQQDRERREREQWEREHHTSHGQYSGNVRRKYTGEHHPQPSRFAEPLRPFEETPYFQEMRGWSHAAKPQSQKRYEMTEDDPFGVARQQRHQGSSFAHRVERELSMDDIEREFQSARTKMLILSTPKRLCQKFESIYKDIIFKKEREGKPVPSEYLSLLRTAAGVSRSFEAPFSHRIQIYKHAIACENKIARDAMDGAFATIDWENQERSFATGRR